MGWPAQSSRSKRQRCCSWRNPGCTGWMNDRRHGAWARRRFAVMACVILPLLPKGPFGPFGGLRPRELWALVLFFSALSFLGHVARRLAGPGHGYLVTGLLGRHRVLDDVTFTFARLSRRNPAMSRALAVRRRGCRRGG